MSDKIILQYNGTTYEFPLIMGTEKEVAIDIKTLRTTTGLVTMDPGYKNTGSCKSAITYLHGEKGILRHRGYAIEDLAEKAEFLEVAYLLIFGELPSQKQLQEFKDTIHKYTLINEEMKNIFGRVPKIHTSYGYFSLSHQCINGI